MKNNLRICQYTLFMVAVFSGLGTSHAALNITPIVDFYEFVSGRQYTKTEKKTIRRLVRAAERDDPDDIADSVKLARSALSKTAKIKNGRKKAMVRDEIAAGLYCSLINDPDADANTFLSIIYKTNPVFASDCSNSDDPVISSRRSLVWFERTFVFTTSRRLHKKERKLVRKYLEQSAKDQPETTVAAQRNIMLGWSELNNSGALERAKTHQESIANMYCSMLASGGVDGANWWFRHDRIVAANCNTNMVISKKKYNAFLNVYNFVSKLGGRRVASTTERRKFLKSVQDDGAAYDPNSGIGYYFDNAILVDLALRRHWSHLTKADQNRIRAQFKQRLAKKEHPVDIAFNIEKIRSSVCRSGNNIFCKKPFTIFDVITSTQAISDLSLANYMFR